MEIATETSLLLSNKNYKSNFGGSINRTGLKVYKYRWVVLVLFCLNSGVNLLQFLQYSIITNIICRFYNVSTFAVGWTSMIYMTSYIALFIPGSYAMERISLRLVAIISSSLTAIGTLIKLLSVHPDRFYILMIGQTFCGLAQIFTMSVPSKLAAVWFGPKQVSTACSLAVFGSQIGLALGSILPSVFVKNHSDLIDVKSDIFDMLLYNALVCYGVFILIVLYFQGRPKLPPSYSQALLFKSSPVSYKRLLKSLLTNRHYVFLIISFGIGNGLTGAFNVLLNSNYLYYFPGQDQDVGLVGFITIVAGGCIGSIFFGYLLDKTHQFRITSFYVFLFASFSYLALSFAMEFRIRLAVFICVAIFGFFVGGSLTIGYEFITELTYPEPESTACALFNAVVLFFSVIFTVIFGFSTERIGIFWTNIVITSLFVLSAVLTTGISSILKRNNANNIQ